MEINSASNLFWETLQISGDANSSSALQIAANFTYMIPSQWLLQSTSNT